MKTFIYQLLPATGNHIVTKVGTLKDLLLDIPYLIHRPKGIIPPLKVINEILSIGIHDAGMSGGCKWEPFQITEKEFNELISEFASESAEFRYIEPEDWVKTYDDWKAWEAERIHGIPAHEYLQLWAELKAADDALRNAEKIGDEKMLENLRKKLKEADLKMTNLIMQYVKYKK